MIVLLSSYVIIMDHAIIVPGNRKKYLMESTQLTKFIGGTNCTYW